MGEVGSFGGRPLLRYQSMIHKCDRCETQVAGATIVGDEVCGDSDEIDDAEAA